jgi:hypothetical protein
MPEQQRFIPVKRGEGGADIVQILDEVVPAAGGQMPRAPVSGEVQGYDFDLGQRRCQRAKTIPVVEPTVNRQRLARRAGIKALSGEFHPAGQTQFLASVGPMSLRHSHRCGPW